MMCPRCAEGMITKVMYKKTGEMMRLCDFCDTFWYMHEKVDTQPGHSLKSLLKNGEYDEDLLDELEDVGDKEYVGM